MRVWCPRGPFVRFLSVCGYVFLFFVHTTGMMGAVTMTQVLKYIIFIFNVVSVAFVLRVHVDVCPFICQGTPLSYWKSAG